jgi:hypothetical protein
MANCCADYAPSFVDCPPQTLLTCGGQDLVAFCECSVGRSSVVNHRDGFFFSWWCALTVCTTAIVCVSSWYQTEYGHGKMRLWLLDKVSGLLVQPVQTVS